MVLKQDLVLKNILIRKDLPISPSPRHPISPSPHLPISPSPHLPVTPSPRHPMPILGKNVSLEGKLS